MRNVLVECHSIRNKHAHSSCCKRLNYPSLPNLNYIPVALKSRYPGLPISPSFLYICYVVELVLFQNIHEIFDICRWRLMKNKPISLQIAKNYFVILDDRYYKKMMENISFINPFLQCNQYDDVNLETYFCFIYKTRLA